MNYLLLLFTIISSLLYADEENLRQDVLDEAESKKEKDFIKKPYAELQFVDKYTGKFSTIVCKVGDTVQSHTLSKKVDRCFSSGPFDPPETKAFLEIEEPDISETPIFKGWMVASIPALSTLEHRRYGVWIKKCSDSPVILEE